MNKLCPLPLARAISLMCVGLIFGAPTAFAQSDLLRQARGAWNKVSAEAAPLSAPVKNMASDIRQLRDSWGAASQGEVVPVVPQPAPGARGLREANRASSQGTGFSMEPSPAITRPDAPSSGRHDGTGTSKQGRVDVRLSDERFVDERTQAVAAPSTPMRRTGPTRTSVNPAIAETETPQGARTVPAGRNTRAVTKPASGAFTDDELWPQARVAQEPPAPVSQSRYARPAALRDTAGEVSGATCTNVSRVWEGAAALAQRGQEARAYDAYLRLLSSCARDDELLGTADQAQRHLGESAMARLLQEPVLASPRLAKALMALKLQAMYSANETQDHPRALALARELRAHLLQSRDPGALEVSGWLEQQAGAYRVAEQLFRAAMRAAPEQSGAAQGLVYALLAQGKLQAVAAQLQHYNGDDIEELRAELLLAQSRDSLAQGNFEQALRQLNDAERMGLFVDDAVLQTRAWILVGLKKHGVAVQLFEEQLAANPSSGELEQGYLAALAGAGNVAQLRQLAESGQSIAPAAREALAQHHDNNGERRQAAALRGTTAEGYAGRASAGLGVRLKSGDEGEDQLTEVQGPSVRVSVPVGEQSQVQVRGSMRSLDDGARRVSGREAAIEVRTQVGDVDVSAEIGASQTWGNAMATFDVAASMPTEEGGWVRARIFRDTVRDSVRAYAGDGLGMGRLHRTELQLAGTSVLEHSQRFKLYGAFSAGAVAGRGHSANTYFSGYTEVTRDFDSERFSWLSAGLYSGIQWHQRDENRFEEGFGGYFSPKSEFSFGTLANLMTQEGNASLYRASIKLGFASRKLHAGADSGLAVEGSLESAWLLSPRVILGAGAVLKTSPGYQDLGFRVGLTLPFEPRTKLYASDLLLGKDN